MTNETVEKDKLVIIDYEGKLEDGTVFDSSKHGENSHPLEFVAGSGMVIPGFDKAVMGMKKGDKKEFIIEPNDAYGEHNPDLKKPIPKSMVKMDKEPEVGMILMMQTPQGQQVPLKILEITKDEVIIDMNHPLAGKKLIFNIEIVDIKDKPKESEHNHVHKHDHDCNCEKDHEHGKDCACEDKKDKTPKKEESIEDLAEGK
jgi:FKBP-type peptidyl-prolyl cis-trans isomerase 2